MSSFAAAWRVGMNNSLLGLLQKAASLAASKACRNVKITISLLLLFYLRMKCSETGTMQRQGTESSQVDSKGWALITPKAKPSCAASLCNSLKYCALLLSQFCIFLSLCHLPPSAVSVSLFFLTSFHELYQMLTRYCVNRGQLLCIVCEGNVSHAHW